MKKKHLFIIILLITIGIIIYKCSQTPDTSKVNQIENGSQNNTILQQNIASQLGTKFNDLVGSVKKSISTLEAEYFTITGASYYDGILPAEDADLISNVQLNKTVINGGSNIINFTSQLLLSELMLSIKGVKGYIVVPLTYTYEGASKLYHYTAILALSQTLSQNFDLDFAVKAENGTISKAYNTSISVIEAGTGSLQISLSWNLDDDVDLHVFEPDGTEVYFAAPFSFSEDMDLNKFYFDRNVWVLKKHKPNGNHNYNQSSLVSRLKLKTMILSLFGKVDMRKETSLFMKANNIAYCGELDIDSNPACNIDGIRNENVFYVQPEPGTYTVKIDLFKKCEQQRNSKDGAKYAVAVKYQNKDMALDSGQEKLSGQFPATMHSNHNNKDSLVEICTFTIPGEKKPSVEKEKVDTDMSIYFDKLFRLIDL